MNPLVSICLPNLNTRPFLEPRMETLLAQTVTDWEIIISDSYSDDGSWEYLNSFTSDPRIRAYQKPRGLYANWNFCIQEGRAPFVYIATSDDTMTPHCLERLLALTERDPSALAVFSGFEHIDAEGRTVPGHDNFFEYFMREHGGERRVSREAALLVALLQYPAWVTVTAALFRRELFDKIGLFRTDLGALADQEFAIRTALATEMLYTPEKLATWRLHEAQGSRAKDYYLHCVHYGITRDFLTGGGNHELLADWDQRAPGWRGELLDFMRGSLRKESGLFRWKLREPGGWNAFRENARLAWKYDREWLINQIPRGFGWSRELDQVGYLHEEFPRLLEKLQIPWPPAKA